MLYFKYFYSFCFALCGAFIAQQFNLPIPWLLGPLFVTALLKINNAPIDCHKSARQIGLLIIGLSLGLYFTPEMIHVVLSHWAVLISGLVFALFLGALSACIIYKWGNVDFKTAWFASAVGGANEMSNLAEQYSARIDKVASAHALRVMLVVVFIPFFYKFMGWHGTDTSAISSIPVNWFNFLILFALCLLGCFIFKKFKLPNPWTFGPLLVAVLLTANSIQLSSIPPSILHLGQVLLGWSLGNKFSQSFFRTAPRYMSVVAFANVLSILFAFICAYVLLFFVDIPLPTLILGLAPGGVAEMTLTAKILHLGVPMVTAFHVVRMIGVMSTVGPLYNYIQKKFKLKIDTE
ncbi:AbrB family transcriptional regulator [Acinetobacter faecalis]|uniref:AbrB family transcriptional regulator n=1 Tax=Acinetobacter faecalis TaxID=2665161 RepID=A0AB35UW14_9GAMM|nr:AbrB family transcriptional regulator [Acinetobacter faecalis]MDY6449678.1 AbrB family transcriptional regulator [Acinetobacter faecalis]MDY6459191.1 AbrB family transcriptional regulator [Acinetobacter faecalis]MDY6462645.1 AbrB family transcriptional regulator [Acinetobacter faecalis]MDY6486882.1 AbrB family transcriptional regulator [Acinetobacter faecalis]MDY6488370.1 AbrB family transcriptional regulator [Acinetobacter faecalis]